MINMVSYHVDIGPETIRTMTELLRRYLPDQPPVWTNVGVATLGDPNMRVEIRVTAVVAD